MYKQEQSERIERYSYKKIGSTEKVIIVGLGILLIAAISSMFIIPSYIQRTSEKEAIKIAYENLDSIEKFRSYYAENIIPKISNIPDIKFDIEHKNISDVIPLPATVMLDLAELISNDDIKINMYSPFPFKKSSAIELSEEKKSTWEYLKENPEKHLVDIENYNGKTIVSVSRANIMTSEGCVSCHNSHPKSYKNDWKIGDLRGVLEIKKDITNITKSNTTISRYIIFTLICFIIVLIYSVNFILRKDRNYQRNRYLANHDALTGLANRSELIKKLSLACENAKQKGTLSALIYMDLNRFKPINDCFGHHAGDYVLKVISRRLLNVPRNSDTVARIGGDEFCILLNDIRSERDVEYIAVRIIALVSENIHIEKENLHVGCSIGAALIDKHGSSSDSIINAADKAMYYTKQNSRRHFMMYDPELLAYDNDKVKRPVQRKESQDIVDPDADPKSMPL